jgi:integrase
LSKGHPATVKTEASEATVYIPPDLQMEFRCWLEGVSADPKAWLFPSPKGLPWGAQNYLNRVLKPAAIRARVGLFKRKTRKGEEVESTDVNFQVLRRTCATLFGAKAKDPRDTQAQLRHADPSVTLRHYQKSIPASWESWTMRRLLRESLKLGPRRCVSAVMLSSGKPEVPTHTNAAI